MRNEIKKYVEEVMRNVHVSRKIKKRFKEDLYSRIEESYNEDPYYNVYESMGDPRELADDFMDNIDSSKSVMVYMGVSYSERRFEYKSKLTIFGIPFIHINTGGRYGNSYAKGVIAIGDIATGVLSVGGVSFGLVSIGGVSIGLATIGGVAIGGFSVGGVALGAYAAGGVAYGFLKGLGALLF